MVRMIELPQIIDWLLILTITNTLLFCLAATSTLKLPPNPRMSGAKLFYYSTYFSQAFLFALCINVFILILSRLMHHFIAFIIVSSCINFIAVMLSFANSIVLYKYRFSLNLDIFRLVFGKGGSEVVQVHPLEYIIFGVGFVAIIAITCALQFLTWHLAADSSIVTVASIISCLFAVIYVTNQIAYLILTVKKAMPILQFSITVYLYDICSLCRLLKLIGIIKDPLYQAFNHHHEMRYPIQPIERTPQKFLNIVLIVVDSLRFDTVTPTIMPNLHAFAQTASRFDKHFSGGNTTQPGIFSIFYGIPPVYWKATQKHQTPPTMITTMQEAGYQLGIFASATLENPPFHKNVFCSVNNLRTYTNGNHPLERDKKITEDMVRFLHERDSDTPFFSFLFYDAPHGYYAIPDLPEHFTPTKHMNHITVNNNSDPTPIKNLYLCAVHETDKHIKTVLDTLKQQNLLDDTIVMITADHGQEFNDLKKNYWEHPSNFARFQTKVPMIVHHPHHPAKQHNYFTTHYDIVPTMMQDALGVTNPISDYSVGHYLFDETTIPFTIMANYTHYAVMERDRIIEIQKSGCYQITDHDMNYDTNPHIDAQALNLIFEHIQRYSTQKIRYTAGTIQP